MNNMVVDDFASFIQQFNIIIDKNEGKTLYMKTHHAIIEGICKWYGKSMPDKLAYKNLETDKRINLTFGSFIVKKKHYGINRCARYNINLNAKNRFEKCLHQFNLKKTMKLTILYDIQFVINKKQ